MPKSAKLADFFQGHFIRFSNQGQAGNGVCELVRPTWWGEAPEMPKRTREAYDVGKDAAKNAGWPSERGAGIFSGRIFRNGWEYLYVEVRPTLSQRLGAGVCLRPNQRPSLVVSFDNTFRRFGSLTPPAKTPATR
jgi:hypothetical protein